MSWKSEDLFCHELATRPWPGIGRILVTGATGYIGGRLVPELLARGYQVRIMVRAASLEHQPRWPGAEIVVADATGLREIQAIEPKRRAACIFEFIYFARPDSNLVGRNVYAYRKELGRVLSHEHEVAADLVTPVLDAWQENPARFPLAFYPAGSWGPAGADELVSRGQRAWRRAGLPSPTAPSPAARRPRSPRRR